MRAGMWIFGDRQELWHFHLGRCWDDFTAGESERLDRAASTGSIGTVDVSDLTGEECCESCQNYLTEPPAVGIPARPVEAL